MSVPYKITRTGNRDLKADWMSDTVLMVNVAKTGVRAATIKENRRIEVDGASYQVAGAVDPYAGVKDDKGRPHINVGKFVEVYVVNGVGSRHEAQTLDTGRRTAEIG